MLRWATAVVVVTIFIVLPSAHAQTSWLDPFRANAGKLVAAAGADQFGWDRLAELTDTYGQRLSGSENLNRAIAWAARLARSSPLDTTITSASIPAGGVATLPPRPSIGTT